MSNLRRKRSRFQLLITTATAAVLSANVPVHAIDVNASLVIDSGAGNAPINTNVNANTTVNGTIATPGLDVSVAGPGSVFVINGGVLNNTGAAINLGVGNGTTGNMGVASGSTITNNQALNIGQAANATGGLSIGSNGTFTQTGAATNIGVAATSNGTLTLGSTSAALPSTFTTSGDLTIGVAGTGTLNVNDNASFSMTNSGLFNVGQSAGSNGAVNVDGANALLTTQSPTSVGAASGTGTMSVTNGGTIRTILLRLGDGASSNGTLTIDGAGSQLMTDADNGANSMIIGNNGVGLANISNSGALTVTDDLTIGAGTNGGTLNITDGGSVTVSDAISIGDDGVGALNILSGSTLSTGTTGVSNAVIGDGVGASGTVTVSGAGSNWNLNNADLTLQGSAGNEAKLIVSDGASLQTTGTISLNNGTNSVGLARIYVGGENLAAAAGNISAGAIQFDLGQTVGILGFNHTDTNYTFSSDITSTASAGARGIVQQSAGTTNLTGDMSGYTGVFAISGGELRFNSAQTVGAGQLSVGSGARVGGVGTINLVSFPLTNPNPVFEVQSGGTLAPGNSIGTMTVNGNVDLQSGSIYEVEIDDAGNTDLLEVNGNLTIDSGATVNLIPENGTDDGTTYTNGQVYTIATATGGVTGTFGSITDNFAFLDGTLGYTANAVTVTVNQVAAFSSVATTSNQVGVANAVSNLGAANSIFSAILPLSAPSAQAAFDALSGEIHSSAKSAFISDSHILRDATLARFDTSRFGSDNNTWIQAYGSFTDLGGNNNATDADVNSGGVVFGFEQDFDGWLGGLAFQIGRSSISIGEGRNSSADSTDYGVGAYSMFSLEEADLHIGGSFVRHNIDTDRNVAFGNFSEKLTADYSATTTQIFGKLSTDLEAENGILRPFVEAAYISHSSDGFTESGGNAALTSQSSTDSTGLVVAGISSLTERTLKNGVEATFKGTLGWQHVFEGSGFVSNHSLGQGGSFAVEGSELTENSLVVDLDASFAVSEQMDFEVKYKGNIGGNGDHSHSLNGGLSFKF